MDFTGVDIRGSRFSSDKDFRTVDYGSLSFKDAIYDENTTYNDIPLTDKEKRYSPSTKILTFSLLLLI